MRVIDIINHAAEFSRLGERNAVPSGIKNKILDSLNIIYKKYWNLYPWDDVKILNVTATTTTGVVTLPHYCDAVRGVRISTTPLFPIGEIFINNFKPENFDEAGTPTNYTFLAKSPVLTQPSAATTISILSSSTSDTSTVGKIALRGLAGGIVRTEELTLNGTTEVDGAVSFTELIQVSKPKTTGRITVQDSANAALAVLQPSETQGKYTRIQTDPIVDTSTTVTVQCQRKFETLTSDNDTILIEAAESAIIQELIARCWQLTQNLEMKQSYQQDAIDDLRVALKKHDELNQRDNRSLPVEGFFDALGDSTGVLDTSITGTWYYA